jgi:hypothetical protein
MFKTCFHSVLVFNAISYQMMFVSYNSSITDATSGAGISYPSWTLEFIPRFQRGVRFPQSVVLCWPLFVLLSFFLANVLSVLRFTAYEYPLIKTSYSCTKSTRNDWIKHNDIVTRFISRYHYQEIEDVQYSMCLYREMWSFKCHCYWRLVTRCTFNDCSF